MQEKIEKMNIEDKQNFEENLVKDNEMTDIPNKVEENNDMKDIDLKKKYKQTTIQK